MPHLEKKIFLSPEDSKEDIIKHLSSPRVARIILRMPPEHSFKNISQLFRAIKREAILKEKEVVIESADQEIIREALEAHIEVSKLYPLKRNEQISDIIKPVTVIHTKKAKEQKSEKDEEQEQFQRGNEEDNKENKEDEEKRETKTKSFHRYVKKILTSVIVIIVGGGGYYLCADILPRVTLGIELQKEAVLFDEIMRVDAEKTTGRIIEGTIVIPGEFLSAKKNIELAFPAHGKKMITVKAQGKLTVINGYSSTPQTLVKGTRIESPKGNIYRFQDKVIVPGAIIKEGKIVPSTIEVMISADDAGETYNFTGEGQWHIPGFKGTPKYDGFYGEAHVPITGGYKGERAEPTGEDIASARNKAKETLKTLLTADMQTALQKNFVALDDASLFTLTKETVSTGKEEGTFTFFGEAELHHAVFERVTAEKIIKEKVKGSRGQSIEAVSSSYGYGVPEVDWNKKVMTIHTKGSFIFQESFNKEVFKKSIEGLSEKDLVKAIERIPGIKKGTIHFWPLWVRHVPLNDSKISIIQGDSPTP